MMAKPWSSLRFRLIAAAAIGLVLGLALVGFVLVKVYEGSVRRGFDQRLESLAHTLIATAEIDADGELVVAGDLGEPLFERAYSGWYWQMSSAATAAHPAATMRRSRSLFDFALKVPAASSQDRGYESGPRDERLRMAHMQVTLPGGAAPFDVVVAGDYGVVDAQVRAYLLTLVAALSGILVLMVLVAFVQERFVLAPLNRVRLGLAAIRDGRQDQLEGEFPVEVAPLVIELNSLLTHNKAVLERARTQVGNLAHALKTPLSVLRSEIEGRTDDFAAVTGREIETMRRQVDHYLTRARAAAASNVLGARTEIPARASALARTLAKLHRDRAIAFDIDCAPGLVFRGDVQDLDEMLGNLLDNAGKWARSRVLLRARAAPAHTVIITVDDDGPGLDTRQLEAVLMRRAPRRNCPGQRPRSSRSSDIR
ncbi:MAG: sensor histidine kinase [Alphaproteobacteria bacterium]